MLALGRAVLLKSEAEPVGRLLVDAGGGVLAVAVDDLKELSGREAAGRGFVSGMGALFVSAMSGGLAVRVGCSLPASGNGVRGGFATRRAGAFEGGFGAGRVYTKTCELEPCPNRKLRLQTYPRGTGRCCH